MRYLPLLFLASCVAYLDYPPHYTSDSQSDYSQEEASNTAEHCTRPSAPSGATGLTGATGASNKAQLCEACKTHDDCAGQGSLCLPNGTCGELCLVDCDCPNTYQCRGAPGQSSRQCVPQSGVCPQCKVDTDCPVSQMCVAQKCVDRCTTDASCAQGERCFEDGRCGVACCLDSDCHAGSHCTNGRCGA